MKGPTKILRAAIYARYSSDLQNPKSVDDQISLCKRFARERFGIEKFVLISHDKGITGETMRRPGLTQLLNSAQEDRLDLVICEGLDRLSRNPSHTAYLHELFEYFSIKLWTYQEGEIGAIHIAVLGTLNKMSNDQMRSKLRRSHFARVEEGRVPSGLTYGYKIIRGKYDERGKPINGLRKIDPVQAEIVKRIFSEFAQGRAIKSIAHGLNEDQIPSPGGGQWRNTSIMGSLFRQEGILSKEIYRGWLVHNKTRKVVNPATGRSVHKPKPESEWIRKSLPELQIISDELWHACQQRLNKDYRPRKASRPLVGKTKNKKSTTRVSLENTRARPLTNLVKCGFCGGFKSIGSDNRYICSTNRYDKKCKNGRGTRERDMMPEVISFLKSTVESQSNWYNEILQEQLRLKKKYADSEARKSLIQQRLSRLVDALEMGIKTEEVKIRILSYERELAEIEVHLSRIDTVFSQDEARKFLIKVLQRIQKEFFVQAMSAPIRALLSLVIHSIVLNPVVGSRFGEDVQIKIKPGGWPEFYQLAQKIFPAKGK